MTDEVTRERALSTLRIEQQHAENEAQSFYDAGAHVEGDAYHEVARALGFAIADLSAPAPAALIDEELREECERLARDVREDAVVAVEEMAGGWWNAYAHEPIPHEMLSDVWASDKRTALLALHAALTVLAQKGGSP